MNKSIVKKVWITERSVELSKEGKYVFIIDKSINKVEAVKALESMYHVTVEKANIINTKPKTKRLGRSIGKTPSLKKIIITLKKGQTIDVIPA